ncbi:MAG: acetyl-CoA carboxylase biotin carboxyl carrier protein [Candidatus Limnocylindrales bacterium]
MTDGSQPIEPLDGSAAEDAASTLLDPGDASLLALVDRLTAMLERSDLAELEVEAGGTGLILRKPVAVAPTAVLPDHGRTAGTAVPGSGTGAGAAVAEGPPAVLAPLTGIFYNAPAPGSAPFVSVGSEVAVGTIIGLIEAMKLFNEIKSDLAGRVVRVVADNGALVKAKQPLIEVEPL